jgi:hypothetical protein
MSKKVIVIVLIVLFVLWVFRNNLALGSSGY